MSVYSIRIHGAPEPQARPRKGKAGNFYSEKTAFYHAVFWTALSRRPPKPIDSPCLLIVEEIHKKPISRPVFEILKDTKPDVDNTLKPVMDALKNGKWFKDDGRVSVQALFKRYALPGENPGAIITVAEIDPRDSGRISRQLNHVRALADK